MKKTIITGHPLDDDGFIDYFLDELTALTNKWGMVIDTDVVADCFLTHKEDFLEPKSTYRLKYDRVNAEYFISLEDYTGIKDDSKTYERNNMKPIEELYRNGDTKGSMS